ncbi:MAG: hypothetical protein IPL40_13815 [Proteobacteria bacterium]|nr:hypothetical protein [Pseudomonadota bacterium]
MVWGSDRVRETLAECGVELAEGDCEAALEGQLTRRGETVRLHGAVRGKYWVPCSRCLGPAAIVVTERALELCFVPPSAGMDDADAARDRAVDREIELAGEDLEVSSHDGAQIDLRVCSASCSCSRCRSRRFAVRAVAAPWPR